MKIIQDERIDTSEGIDINKSYESTECMICHYRYFLDIGYEYEQYVCNGCHDLSMMVFDFDDFTTLNIKGVDCRCFVCNMSKNTAIKLFNDSQFDS